MECGTHQNYKEAYRDLISVRITDGHHDHLTGIFMKIVQKSNYVKPVSSLGS